MIQLKAFQYPFGELVLLCFLFCIAGCANPQKKSLTITLERPASKLSGHFPGKIMRRSSSCFLAKIFSEPTPAKDVIINFYHTNTEDLAAANQNATGSVWRYGALSTL